jgi:hypothetical protein
VRCAGKDVPEREVVLSWGTMPPLGAVFGGCAWELDCAGVVEGGGASIFMALDSWGCCAAAGLADVAGLSIMISMSSYRYISLVYS